MKYNKESLEKLLLLIDEICNEEENLWFKENLKNKYGVLNTKGDFPEFFKLLKKQYKTKANKFYKTITDENLKKELSSDYINMLKYQSINDIGKFIIHVFYQMENMLNYYLLKSNSFNKIQTNKNYYINIFSEKFIVVCYDNFFYKEMPNSVEKISIWAKIVFWAYDTSNQDFLTSFNFHFSNLVNIRNQEGHRNSLKEINDKITHLINTINNLKESDFSDLSFYVNILKKILDTLNNINSTIIQYSNEPFIEKKQFGIKIIGKIDLNK